MIYPGDAVLILTKKLIDLLNKHDEGIVIKEGDHWLVTRGEFKGTRIFENKVLKETSDSTDAGQFK